MHMATLTHFCWLYVILDANVCEGAFTGNVETVVFR